MSIQHDKVPTEQFQPGKHYRVALRGKDLYTAEVSKFHGGCWATVTVIAPADESVAHLYKEGVTFDIKVAEYDITPAKSPQSLS